VKVPDTTIDTPTYRLIPTRFPPIELFDTVATAADARAVMELAGWTNDRLVEARLRRLPEDQWVFGRTNASIVMASFLHVAPTGSRFNGSELGAWYASMTVETAIVEVAHHLRREAVNTGVAGLARQFRAYSARLDGVYVDVRNGGRPARIDAPDSYVVSQAFGESVRTSDRAGIVYLSVRYPIGVNVVAYRPRNILDVMQAYSYQIEVEALTTAIRYRRLTA
jgi:hypothetical protein